MGQKVPLVAVFRVSHARKMMWVYTGGGDLTSEVRDLALEVGELRSPRDPP